VGAAGAAGARGVTVVALPRGVTPWTPLVSDRDVIFYRPGVCSVCERPLDHEHDAAHVLSTLTGKCWKYSERLRGRYRLIARFHLIATHPLAAPHHIEFYAAARAATIADLAMYEELDRPLYQEVTREVRADVDRMMVTYHDLRHLDEGWDGKGPRPSEKAALFNAFRAAYADDLRQPASVADQRVSAWWVILGVSQSASAREVRAAYRAEAKRCHPDRANSRHRWQRLREAYELAQAQGRA
jgi:hypothetical protein